MAAMPTKDAKRYMEREMANLRYMHRQFLAELRAARIKYYLSLIICLLSYGLLIANILTLGRLIGNPGAAIILATVVAPASFLAVIFCRVKYHELNG